MPVSVTQSGALCQLPGSALARLGGQLTAQTSNARQRAELLIENGSGHGRADRAGETSIASGSRCTYTGLDG
jgi:hypothetical protein